MSRDTEPVLETEAAQPEPWNPVLFETLHALVHRSDLGAEALESELWQLEERYGDDVYAELLLLLSHLRFSGAEAKAHWKAIARHRVRMRRKLGVPVDLRVALLSFFIDVNRRLENPKIIEMKLFEQTRTNAYRDELTGLCNYRMFREHLEREVLRADRDRGTVSLVMIDVDDFKLYNDRNGHETGNEALIAFGHLLSACLRKLDVAARYGGEEFALILPSTSKMHAELAAERVRERIEKHVFPNENVLPGGTMTASLGLATYPGDATTASGLVRSADVALYAAKSRGKNRVHLFGEDRRSFRRVGASLEGTYCVAVAEQHPANTINISESGVLLMVNRNLPSGSLLELSLNVPGFDREINASGRVVRVEQRGENRFEAAIRILDMDTRDRRLLAGYLREEATADAT